MSATRLVCAGCGWVAPVEEPLPFRCPGADRAGAEDVDHVLRRQLDADTAVGGTLDQRRALFLDPEPEPFLRYRRLLHAYHAARERGLRDAAFVDLVKKLDEAIARNEGQGFRVTPFGPAPELGRAVGLGPAGLWVKDETGNVAGSHKARHLMGVMLWLEAQERLGALALASEERPLAISSCGNAALAAAVVARAAERSLDVFIPPEAHPKVVERLQATGARLHLCEREGSEPGDPCYLGFRAAVEAGALPFTCQGNENGLVIEGGATLGYEMVSSLLAAEEHLDHVVIQVGGGALASACILALRDAQSLGVVDFLPRIHTVQTSGAYPLQRAYDRLMERICVRLDGPPAAALETSMDAARLAEAERVLNDAALDLLGEEISFASRHRSEFMVAWDKEPRSIATGILDDETYDWLYVVEGMLETGGIPMVASEELLIRANRLAVEHTGIPVDETGSAGLAGLLTLVERRLVREGETVAVLFTGVRR